VDLLHPFIYLLFHFQAISTFSHFLISQLLPFHAREFLLY
jgi:hypothetical protein